MGFFVQRHTLKLSILAAILKPNIRSIEPNIEPNLDSPRGRESPKAFRYLEEVPDRLLLPFPTFPCAPRYVNSIIKVLLFWFWLTLVSLAMFIRGIRYPLAIIISRPVV